MDGDALLVPDDTAMVQLLDRIGVSWERRLAVFQPIGKAHSHDDPHPNHNGADRLRVLASDHSHDHSHDDSEVHSIERPNGR
jgi:hypothetical protein